ncbi:BTAD domain-containing putative transcriptional regulator [Paenibacillus sp. MBLB4367]|uniref:AfsR/SARP family transcriptional regulator n=1 Tax=Paenibacillus sp. MBLB4367 TaxID=3384767 RepID=UPI003907EF51
MDVTKFEQAAQSSSIHEIKQAVSLYGGPLLPSCYEDWIEPERDRLAQMYQSALERLVSKLELTRQYDEALRYAKLLLGQDQLREENYQLLMRLQGSVS